ncbi:MAG: T9SS type A sorting domain-containing protein [candidate division Zixibacteria bacterium]|nr:T9SS type A sorting domain-containing protein [candidate division Zixibacteria bacterium]
MFNQERKMYTRKLLPAKTAIGAIVLICLMAALSTAATLVHDTQTEFSAGTFNQTVLEGTELAPQILLDTYKTYNWSFEDDTISGWTYTANQAGNIAEENPDGEIHLKSVQHTTSESYAFASRSDINIGSTFVAEFYIYFDSLQDSKVIDPYTETPYGACQRLDISNSAVGFRMDIFTDRMVSFIKDGETYPTVASFDIITELETWYKIRLEADFTAPNLPVQVYRDDVWVGELLADSSNGASQIIRMLNYSRNSSSGTAESHFEWIKYGTKEESYLSTGMYTSDILVLDAGSLGVFLWSEDTATVRSGGRDDLLLFETRSSSDGSNWEAWQSVTNGGTIQSNPEYYFQYRATFDRISETESPMLSEVNFSYQEVQIGEISLLPASQEVSVGYNITVDLYFDHNIEDVRSGDLDIGFDESYLSLVDVYAGPDMPINHSLSHLVSTDQVHIDFEILDPSPLAGPGTILTIEFTALAEVDPTSISFISSTLQDDFLQDLDHTTVDAEVTVVLILPDVPVLIEPEEEVITNNSLPTFIWSETTDEYGHYNLQYSLDPGFGPQAVTVSNLTDTTYTPSSALVPDGIWYWRVEAYNLSGGSGYQASSGSFTVDTDPPDYPVLFVPADESYINDNTPEFIWSATGGVGGKYTLEYSTDPGFSSDVITVIDIQDTVYSPTIALEQGVYYWHVMASDAAGNQSGYQPEALSFTLDTTAPEAPTGFTVLAGHQKCKLSWTNPVGDPTFEGVMISRNPWLQEAYPEYDDEYPNPLGYPDYPNDGSLVYMGIGESYRDSSGIGEMPRNVYYYTIFSYDQAGNYSSASVSQQGRATNYWLGDISGDGSVYYTDLVELSMTYWLGAADPGYNDEFDIGPTDDGSSIGIPLTDNMIDFEDLILFAINYGTVGPNSKDLPGEYSAGSYAPARIYMQEAVRVKDRSAGTIIVDIHLAEIPADIAGASIVVDYNPDELEFIGVSKNAVLAEAGNRVFMISRDNANGIEIDLAFMENGLLVNDDHALTQITFRKKSGKTHVLDFADVILRDRANNEVPVVKQEFNGMISSQLPAVYKLSQNRPNPFNMETVIYYDMPKAGYVSLKIYNIQGQVVNVLASNYQDAGRHYLSWNGRNEAGQEVASGVYFYRIETGNYSQTRKMTLLK